MNCAINTRWRIKSTKKEKSIPCKITTRQNPYLGSPEESLDMKLNPKDMTKYKIQVKNTPKSIIYF
jgi:hypothetical protein